MQLLRGTGQVTEVRDGGESTKLIELHVSSSDAGRSRCAESFVVRRGTINPNISNIDRTDPNMQLDLRVDAVYDD